MTLDKSVKWLAGRRMVVASSSWVSLDFLWLYVQ